MSWFEAWLIWRLGAIQDICIFLAVVMGSVSLVFFIMWLINAEENYEREVKYTKIGRRWTKITFILFLPCLFLCVLVPRTETFFKIIATKYGADALTSQKASEIGNNVLESIEKAQQVIDKKLDALLENKKGKNEK